jgi:hypothetical protein
MELKPAIAVVEKVSALSRMQVMVVSQVIVYKKGLGEFVDSDLVRSSI